jgi:hypothetical protein
MKKILSPLLLISFFLSAHTGFCQYSEPSTTRSRDSLPPRINWNEPAVKRSFPYKSFIVPSAMLAYGVFSLQNNGLRTVNEKLKEEVYMERSSKQTTPIDNILPFVPIAAVYGLNAMGIQGKNNFRDPV